MNRNVELARKIITATNRIDGIYYLWSKKSKIQSNMLVLLYALSDGKKHTQKEICTEYIVPKSTINTLVKECVEKDLIYLTNTFNLKEKYICLTEKGREYTNKIIKDIKEIEEAAMNSTLKIYSENFIGALEFFVKKMEEEFSIKDKEEKELKDI